MSVKKTLKENTSISIVDLFEIIFPNVKTKYYELFVKIIENKVKYSENVDLVISSIEYHLNGNVDIEKIKNVLSKYSNCDLYTLSHFMSFLNNECYFDINSLSDFIKYNENNMIEKNDLTTYSTYDDIIFQTSLANMKQINKEFENQIITLYENLNDGWLVIKPLTHNSSIKYGYGTKWCTTMKEEDDYFRRYTSNGILIYCINKKSGNKVAAYKEFNDDHEYSFWNMKDKRVDSMQTDLPQNILQIIVSDFKLNTKTNKEILFELLNNDEELFNKYYYSNHGSVKKISVTPRPIGVDMVGPEGAFNDVEDNNELPSPDINFDERPIDEE